ncbi:MAG: flagellar export protein FliJ [Mesorhizobium sp.]|nr:flagellar export protein FliJ [Mesorhizobium sp.]
MNVKRRKLAQLDLMFSEFESMDNDLDAQIAAEERKAGITDINHFAYPTFAKAARMRRDNLKNSQSDLLQQKSGAEAGLSEAEADLAKAEMLETRDIRQRESEIDTRRAMIG